MESRLLFIINSISGGISKQHLTQEILEVFSDFTYQLRWTEYAGHASQIAREEFFKTDLVIIIGGDGTICEILPELLNHPKILLTILPYGSGNAIARYFNFSKNLKELRHRIIKNKLKKIDLGRCNRQYFLGFTGLGLDAEIAKSFQNSKKRGFLGYISHTLQVFWTFKPIAITLNINNKIQKFNNILLCTFANVQQFGNHFYIAPQASAEDGFFTVAVLRKFPLYLLPQFLYLIFTKKIQDFRYYQSFLAQKIELDGNNFNLNLDGEFVKKEEKLEIEILPQAISVLI